MVACLLVTAIASSYGKAFFPWAVAAAAGLTITGVFGLLYANWTPLGLGQVMGVEGRHFVPLALVVALALPNLRWARWVQVPGCRALAAMGVVTPVVVVHHFVSDFYIR